MARSFKEIGKKAEELIKHGNEAERRVQVCQGRIASANTRVAMARAQLAAVSETDEDGNPKGDIQHAQAQLSVAQNQLAASQRALSTAQSDVAKVNQEKQSHVQTIEQHNRTERSNLQKLHQLEGSAFSQDSATLTKGMAERLNAAEDTRVALLRSMDIEATAEYVSVAGNGNVDSRWRGGSFTALDITGQLQSYRGGTSEGTGAGNSVAAPAGGALGDPFGVPNANQAMPNKATPAASAGEIPSDSSDDSNISSMDGLLLVPTMLESYYNNVSSIICDEELTESQKKQMLTALRSQLISAAQIDASRLEARAIKEKVLVERMTAQEKRERGTRYIENILDVYRGNLLGRGVQEGKELDDFMSVLRTFYRTELDKDIAGLPNQLYEDPNYDTICRLSVPFVMGVHRTLTESHHEDVREIYKQYANKVTVCDTNYSGIPHYKANTGVFFLKSQAMTGDRDLHKPYQTGFHEFAHNIDYLMGNGSPISESWGNNELYRAICKDFETLRDDRTNEQLVTDLRKEMRDANWTPFQIGSVSDILECMTGIDYPLGVGHGKQVVRETAPDGSIVEKKVSYWYNRQPNKEFFAETLDGAAANEDSYLTMKRFFPNAVSVVHKIIGGTK